MGYGSTSSAHFDEKRDLSAEFRELKRRVAQQQAVIINQDRKLQKLAVTLADRDNELAEYRQCFGPIAFNSMEDD